MKQLLIILTIFCTPLWAAEAFKWTDADGRVHYTDKPVGEARAIRLPGRSAPAAPEDGTDRAAEVTQPAAAAPNDAGYTAFQIVQPEDNQTFRTDSGEVNIGIHLEPGLKDGHSIKLSVDGTYLKDSPGGTQMVLRNLGRGSHRLVASIYDEGGKLVTSTPAVSFHMRRAVPESPAP